MSDLRKLEKLKSHYNKIFSRKFGVVYDFLEELQKVNEDECLKFAEDYNIEKSSKELKEEAASDTLDNILALADRVEKL